MDACGHLDGHGDREPAVAELRESRLELWARCEATNVTKQPTFWRSGLGCGGSLSPLLSLSLAQSTRRRMLPAPGPAPPRSRARLRASAAEIVDTQPATQLTLSSLSLALFLSLSLSLSEMVDPQTSAQLRG